MRRREFLARLAGLLAGGVAAARLAGRVAGQEPPRPAHPGAAAGGSSAAAGESGATAPRGRLLYGDDEPGAGRLPRRLLGTTGVSLPVLGLGGHHLGLQTEEAGARALVDSALAEGIRFFDTAEQYQRGDGSRSERWLGLALEGRREQVFLMTKTWAPEERSAQSARDHLAASLERLRTDVLDLWQLHAIQSVEDVDRAFGPGGAMEAILEAKARGQVRFVGVTGHADPAAHLRALEHWDAGLRFDAVQMPLNPLDHHQLSFERRVLPELERRGIAVLAMKTAASGALLAEGLCSVEECLRYVLSLPVAVLISGMETPAQVRANAAAVRQGALEEEAVRALRERLAPRARLDLEWYKQG